MYLGGLCVKYISTKENVMNDARKLLRGLNTLVGPLPLFDTSTSASTPKAQFLTWFEQAIAAGVREPHTMTLSTVDDDGHPDARVLILKDLDERGWHFAASAASPKGVQLFQRPDVALTFYWPEVGRQVRMQGAAIALTHDVNAADFLARPRGSRAGALVARQSDVLASPADLEAALSEQYGRMARQPDLVAPAWTVYAVRPERVEFWQGDTQRRHTRLRYRLTPAGWEKELLWP